MAPRVCITMNGVTDAKRAVSFRIICTYVYIWQYLVYMYTYKNDQEFNSTEIAYDYILLACCVCMYMQRWCDFFLVYHCCMLQIFCMLA